MNLIQRHHPAQPVVDITRNLGEPPRLLEKFGFMRPHPCDLGGDIVRVGAIAADADHLVMPQLRRHLRGFRFRPPIHPDQRRTHRLTLRIQRDHRGRL